MLRVIMVHVTSVETLVQETDPHGAMDAVFATGSVGEPQTTPYGFVMPVNLAISAHN